LEVIAVTEQMSSAAVLSLRRLVNELRCEPYRHERKGAEVL